MLNRSGMTMAGAGIAMLLSLAMTGCTVGPTSAGGESSESAEGEATQEGTATEVDCAAVGEVFISFATAALSGISTEVTNGEVADNYAEVLDKFNAVAAPADAEQWDTLGAVIEKYATEWAALPADGGAIENIEAVEDTVDDFAESQGFDNDDYEDVTPIVGAECNAELEAAFE